MQNYAVQTTDAQGVNWLFFVAANSAQDAIESAAARSKRQGITGTKFTATEN
jgi:hypothetical protein